MIDYAERYVNLLMKDTKFLAYRDVPALVEKYVDGNLALDYGCGPGQSTMLLKATGLHVEGVDINEYMIETAKKRDPKGSYEVIQSGELTCEDERYDVVMSGLVLPFVSTKMEIVKILQELARVLKKGKIFMLIVCNENTYSNSNFVSIDASFEENNDLITGSTVRLHFKEIDLTVLNYYWTFRDYVKLLCVSGFTIIDVQQPLGRDEDGIEWLDEKKASPFTIFIARKL